MFIMLSTSSHCCAITDMGKSNNNGTTLHSCEYQLDVNVFVPSYMKIACVATWLFRIFSYYIHTINRLLLNRITSTNINETLEKLVCNGHQHDEHNYLPSSFPFGS